MPLKSFIMRGELPLRLQPHITSLFFQRACPPLHYRCPIGTSLTHAFQFSRHCYVSPKSGGERELSGWRKRTLSKPYLLFCHYPGLCGTFCYYCLGCQVASAMDECCLCGSSVAMRSLYRTKYGIPVSYCLIFWFAHAQRTALKATCHWSKQISWLHFH